MRVSIIGPAIKLAKHLLHEGQTLLVIHYSCQSLNDTNEGLSPRITSIGVHHIGSATTHSFSLHITAELRHIPREKISENLDAIEAEMLEEFYIFVKDKLDCNWIHWNMNNIHFGFETLAHRFKVLTGKPAPIIPDTKRLNLSALILSQYGSKCVDDPKMLKLMELNGEKHRDFLTGPEESAAYKEGRFVQLHKSTLCKVYWFHKMLERLAKRKIKTQRNNLGEKINTLMETTPLKMVGVLAAGFTVYKIIAEVLHYFRHTGP